MPKRKTAAESDEYDEDDSFLCGSSDEEELKPPKKARKTNIRKDDEVDSDYCSKSTSSRSTMVSGVKREFVKAELEKVNESLREVGEESEVEGESESEEEESLSEGDTSNEDDSSTEEEEEQPSTKIESGSAKSEVSEESEEEWGATKSLNKAFKPKAKAVRKKNTIAVTKSKREKASQQQKSPNVKLSDFESENESEVEVASDTDEKEQKLEIVEDEILEMYNNASYTEFLNLSNISKTKWAILIAQRPFEDYNDLNEKLKKTKLSHMLTSVIEMLNARNIVNNLMIKCKQISKEVKRKIEKVVDTEVTDTTNLENNHNLVPQPKVLSKKLQLKSYQLIGINWLILMHENKLNSILADEMGLGKTCQTIAFLAHLYEQNPNGLNLIVVPSSTLDNWAREIRMWFPKYLFIMYKGNQMMRREIRDDIKKQTKKRNLNAILTTYNYVSSSDADKAFFRGLRLEYCVYDEAHILRNMQTLKYKALLQIKSKRRLLLTGTPLQNNIVELMSLLYFVTPSIFQQNANIVNKMFLPKKHMKNDLDAFYMDKIKQVREIMNPFVLRRLKTQVLKELPAKSETIIRCDMPARQRQEYDKLKNYFKKRQAEYEHQKELQESGALSKSGPKIRGDPIIKILIDMRKAANHALLMRSLYTDDKLEKMASLIVKDSPPDVRYDYVLEDMKIMNDFELHKLCSEYSCIKSYELDNEEILSSGKFEQLDILLAEAKAKGDRVLIFSQFVIMLNIIQEYLRIRKHKFLRLDGSTKVESRQDLIDEFNNDPEILAFILTTKAGGVGINLIGANKVIIHDIDYNPQNDKQAEDRCHRVGQVKEVDVYKLICKDSVDESMIGTHYTKLSLDANISNNDDSKAKLEVMKNFKNLLD